MQNTKVSPVSYAWTTPDPKKDVLHMTLADGTTAIVSGTHRWSEATIQTAHGTWYITRTGRIRETISMRRDGDIQPTSTFRSQWLTSNGTATFANGTVMRWSFGPGRWRSANKAILMTYKLGSTMGSTGSVEVAQGIETQPENIVLLLLGWYMVLAPQRNPSIFDLLDFFDSPR